MKMGKHETGYCPNCSEITENCEHIFHCQNPEMIEEREILDRKFLFILQTSDTPDSVAHLLYQGLKYPNERERHLRLIDMAQPQLQPALRKLMNNLKRKGFLVQAWTKALSSYRQTSTKKIDIYKWERRVIQALLDRLRLLWKKRCQLMKGKESTYTLTT